MLIKGDLKEGDTVVIEFDQGTNDFVFTVRHSKPAEDVPSPMSQPDPVTPPPVEPVPPTTLNENGMSTTDQPQPSEPAIPQYQPKPPESLDPLPHFAPSESSPVSSDGTQMQPQ
jgi:hypothetical protein